MNLAIQQPLRYPSYMDARHLPVSNPWSSMPYRVPMYPQQQQFRPSYPISQPLPTFVFPQQTNHNIRSMPPSSPYTNTRYQYLKKSTSHPSRRSLHRSYDVSTRSHRSNEPMYTQQYRPSRTKSISDLEQTTQFTSAPLSKAHSWHAMANHRRSNLSVAYAQEMHISPKRHRKNSLPKKKKMSPRRRLPSHSPKRKPSFNHPRKRSVQTHERGPIRISTLDEMPIPTTKSNSINNDRLSTKGSISNSSTRHIKSKGNNSIKNRKINIVNNNNNNNNNPEDSEASIDTLSTSSSRSRSSFQQRLNGSLRNDPLISAAMEDFREFRRSSSQNLSLIASSRDPSRDSLRSDSTFHSSSRSRSHSQSSFTSLERSEIRELIKTIRTKDKQSLKTPLLSSSASEHSTTINSLPSSPIIKSKKSCITEELDREFNKLRALDPEQDITYVTPSAICKRKRTMKKPAPIIPPLPTLDELLRQVQLRPVDKSIKPRPPIKEKLPTDDIYENPLSPIPVPQCSPIPQHTPIPECSPVPSCSPVTSCSPEPSIEEMKHEYALPIKKVEEKSIPRISHFQPMRNHSFSKPINNYIPEKRPIRPLSMFNWFHNNPPNSMLTTFQPNRIINNKNELGTPNVNENIYTTDIDVYVPISSIEKNDDGDDSLQIHIDNQTILTDDFYSDYEAKQGKNSSSVLNDFSHLFARKHRQYNTCHKKNQRCSVM